MKSLQPQRVAGIFPFLRAWQGWMALKNRFVPRLSGFGCRQQGELSICNAGKNWSVC